MSIIKHIVAAEVFYKSGEKSLVLLGHDINQNPDNARAKKRNTKSYKKTRIRLYTNGTCAVINGKMSFWFGLYPPPDKTV